MRIVPGLLVSLIGHCALLYYILFALDFNPHALIKPKVYSVSIEAGKKLGGISQIPKKKKSTIAPPKKVKAEEKKPKPKKAVKRKKAVKEKKEKAEVSVKPKKKEKEPTATPKPTPKPKPKATPKPKPTPKPTPKPLTAAEIDKRLQKAVQRYTGSSTSAGGKGFGAGRIGGKGMGGGYLVSSAFLRYKELLERHIKTGWRWYDPKAPLKAQVEFFLSPEGQISGVRLLHSSGSREFDDSVIRAVRKSNPAPPPPPDLYKFFNKPRILFEPE